MFTEDYIKENITKILYESLEEFKEQLKEELLDDELLDDFAIRMLEDHINFLDNHTMYIGFRKND